MNTESIGTVVEMGVSGCGKSTVAALIAEQLSIPFVEADSFHPAANIKKMSDGIPLDDSDRFPWLETVRNEVREQLFTHRGCVVACSALKASYRTILAQSSELTRFVYLKGSFDTIYPRMSARTGHFMPKHLLESQFETLEEPAEETGVFSISIESDVKTIATAATTWINSDP